MTHNLRSFDTVARYGGEEFVVVMPDTLIGIACVVAERLRADIASKPFAISRSADEVNVTISIGVAEARLVDETTADLLRRADEALFSAKRSGRNRAVLRLEDGFQDVTVAEPDAPAAGVA